MTARAPMVRKMTAREMAERLGITERHVRTLIAQPRDEYEKAGEVRGQQILAMRARGKSWPEIGRKFNISAHAALMAGKRARERAASKAA